jgi:hypothetical protein
MIYKRYNICCIVAKSYRYYHALVLKLYVIRWYINSTELRWCICCCKYFEAICMERERCRWPPITITNNPRLCRLGDDTWNWTSFNFTLVVAVVQNLYDTFDEVNVVRPSAWSASSADGRQSPLQTTQSFVAWRRCMELNFVQFPVSCSSSTELIRYIWWSKCCQAICMERERCRWPPITISNNPMFCRLATIHEIELRSIWH